MVVLEHFDGRNTTIRSSIENNETSICEQPQVMGSALARLILDPALDQVTGRYFDGLKKIRSSDDRSPTS